MYGAILSMAELGSQGIMGFNLTGIGAKMNTLNIFLVGMVNTKGQA